MKFQKRRDGIAKRLDRFLMAERVLEEFGMYKVWVGFGFLSNHVPILL